MKINKEQDSKLRDLNISSIRPLLSPSEYEKDIPLTREMANSVKIGRESINAIVNGKDDRLIVIVGPCSIHDTQAATDYAKKLVKLSKVIESKILVVMRVYFEKPRTTLGWKGMVYDPHLNGSFDIEEGLRRARTFLSDITKLGVLSATEFVDPITPQYIADFVSWAAIGARTAESQTHRQMASGLSMAVGIKNGTGGSVQLAVDAIVAVNSKHAFLGVDSKGTASVVMTSGNPYAHLVLRGGANGPNFDKESVEDSIKKLNGSSVNDRIIIDCSHANCQKKFELEPKVFDEVLSQRLSGNKKIVGVMLESNLNSGKQDLDEKNPSSLQYGVSITDPCLGWEETEDMLLDAFRKLS